MHHTYKLKVFYKHIPWEHLSDIKTSYYFSYLLAKIQNNWKEGQSIMAINGSDDFKCS